MSRKKLAMAEVVEQDNEEVPADMQTPQEAAAAAARVTPESDPDSDVSEVSNGADEANEQTEEEELSAAEKLEQEMSNQPEAAKLRRKYINAVAKCGSDRGAGGKALVTFAKTVVEGAEIPVLKPQDAKALYEAFKRGAEKAGVLPEAPGIVPDADIATGEASTKDAKNKSFDVQVSKLRAFIKFGNEYRNADVPASEIIAAGIRVHLGMMADKVENIKYKSTYTALQKLATEQMKDSHAGVAMTDDEIYDLFMGNEPKTKTGLDLVKAALDLCSKALKGKAETDNTPGREAVSSANLEEAVDALRRTINELDPSGKTLADIDAKAKKAAEKNAVAEFKAALKTPRFVPDYRLITHQ
jgi:hypothetical protein